MSFWLPFRQAKERTTRGSFTVAGWKKRRENECFTPCKSRVDVNLTTLVSRPLTRGNLTARLNKAPFGVLSFIKQELFIWWNRCKVKLSPTGICWLSIWTFTARTGSPLKSKEEVNRWIVAFVALKTKLSSSHARKNEGKPLLDDKSFIPAHDHASIRNETTKDLLCCRGTF